MNKDTLIQLFKAPYIRQSFIDNGLLPTFQGKVINLKIYDAQGLQPIELTASEQNYAVSAVKYGEFQTLDEIPRTVELFEIIVNDNKQIERSRVGLGSLVKKHIIGNNAVLVNFAYQNPEKRTWRFSFIARDGVFQDGEMQIKDTHPKRYTYVFGELEETYKTALDRFFILGNELEITINKIKDAFGVEAMSNQFFEDYKYVYYAGFVELITGERLIKRSNSDEWQITNKPHLQFFNCFKLNQTEEKGKKDVRDFVKKLLGRIVFLYFLQKKGWLGAKDTSYKNGDKNFMTNFFKKAGAKDAFYANWLSKLFFDALNNERTNDDFIMPDGEVVKIPYLNGGLFEKETEKYDYLTFPADLFTNLFEFLDQYNFTIFEDSPEEHTVAVDPEMLGHIFENLLEDNKDKGAFYTPKEIVHYMTQESLIEYLHTQIPEADRTELENFVKSKDNKLSKEHKAAIDQKLDTVKICDPAIGSGAFPMGLLQEIFGLKERIAYDLGYKVWSPATVKQNIIQKSIYGVDIERGAVDIARLRFWLSLIVDEEMPKALPNLDYKIVVGNSLVSKFDDTVIEIDWDRKGGVGEADKLVQGVQTALKSISEKQKQFFESKSNKQKAKLKAEIRDLKLDVLINQLSFNKASYLNKNQKVIDMGFGLKATDHKKNLEIDLQVDEFDQALAKLKRLKDNPDQDFNHFDWKLDFPEVLNPLVNEITGFDIVIGNPPYGVSIKDNYRKEVLKIFGKVPDFEIYYFFTELALRLVKENGVKSYIIPNTFLFNTFAEQYRKHLLENWDLVEVLDCTKFNIFQTATVRNTITLWKKSKGSFVGYKQTKNKVSFIELSKSARQTIRNEDLLKINQNWGLAFFLDKEAIERIAKIKSNKINLYTIYPEISQGLIAYDKYRGQSKEIIETRAYHFTEKTKDDLKKWLWGADVTRYQVEWNKSEYIDYNADIANPRDPKYFQGERLLIREITNPTVFAAITDKELYNDPAIIIVKSNSNYSVKPLVGIINSKLATYYHFNNSPKATKGAFPKILVKDIKEFPLPKKLNEVLVLTNLVNHILSIKKLRKILIESIPNNHIAEDFEEVIDALVFELYFPEEFAAKGIEIEKYAQEIFKSNEGLKEEEQIEAIQEAYQTLREKDNLLRNQIKLMKIELKELLLPILSV
jgi:adenine-specific DNA-methyltransferase